MQTPSQRHTYNIFTQSFVYTSQHKSLGQSYLNEQPSVSRALPPVGWHNTVLQLPHRTTVWACEKTVVILKHPGHLTSYPSVPPAEEKRKNIPWKKNLELEQVSWVCACELRLRERDSGDLEREPKATLAMDMTRENGTIPWWQLVSVCGEDVRFAVVAKFEGLWLDDSEVVWLLNHGNPKEPVNDWGSAAEPSGSATCLRRLVSRLSQLSYYLSNFPPVFSWIYCQHHIITPSHQFFSCSHCSPPYLLDIGVMLSKFHQVGHFITSAEAPLDPHSYAWHHMAMPLP